MSQHPGVDDRPLVYRFDVLRETDIVAESTRRSMEGNTGKDTSPEIKLRARLWADGLRGYRKNVASLPGKPDIVFGKARLAIFVHGCFWHQCPKCARNRKPKTNPIYWSAKFEANADRDRRSSERLVEMGYEVIVVWECEIKADLDRIIAELQIQLDDRNPSLD